MPRKESNLLRQAARRAIEALREASEAPVPDDLPDGVTVSSLYSPLYSTLDALEKGDLDADWSALEQLEAFLQGELEKMLRSLGDELIDPWGLFRRRPEKWTPLRNRPKEFTKELEKHLSAIRECMLAYYDVGQARGRPPTEEERDKKICQLRSEGKTFGQIGSRLRISPKTAGTAFRRAQKKKSERLETISKRYATLSQLFKSVAS